jgi:hypothetical protein
MSPSTSHDSGEPASRRHRRPELLTRRECRARQRRQAQRRTFARRGAVRIITVLGLATAVGLAVPAATGHLSTPGSSPGSTAGSTAIAPVLQLDRTRSSCPVGDHFGRMFADLPAARWSPESIDSLSTAVMAEQEDDPTPEDQQDDEENLDIPAGYTYAGQFIDHDLTLGNEGDLTGTVDPGSVLNQRTPQFDLDSVYGDGPSASPQLYQADGMHLVTGAALSGAPDSGAVDLARDAQGQALLGDPRNDENRLVGSLHSLVIRFHNLEVDRIRAADPRSSPARVFAAARQLTRWHYQWAVLTDFLPTVVGRQTMAAVLPSLDLRRARPDLRFYHPCTMQMPVEFADAAYRYGHSQVRAIYRINSATDRMPVFTTDFDPTHSLVGFQPAPANFGVDWSLFFPMDADLGINHPQDSYKIDNSLVHPLSLLPLPTGGGNLASRNLLRGEQMSLPSGQDVARAMGVTPLRDDQILLGKATGDPADSQIATAVSPEFAGRVPLWTYVLAESINQAYDVSDGAIQGEQVRPYTLGPVGGRIVAETMVGLMLADPRSVLHSWFRPDRAFSTNGRFGFRELIAAVDGHDLARGAAVSSASSTAGMAVDGDPASAAVLTQGQNLTVDLGSTVTVGRVHLDWAGSPPSSWALQVGDGTSWTTVADSGRFRWHGSDRRGSGGSSVGLVERVGLRAAGNQVRLVLGRDAAGASVAELCVYAHRDLPVT